MWTRNRFTHTAHQLFFFFLSKMFCGRYANLFVLFTVGHVVFILFFWPLYLFQRIWNKMYDYGYFIYCLCNLVDIFDAKMLVMDSIDATIII